MRLSMFCIISILLVSQPSQVVAQATYSDQPYDVVYVRCHRDR